MTNKTYGSRGEIDYYRDRLAEPELLSRAVLLDVDANQESFAVPVGKLRKGGDIEFLRRSEAEKALRQLKGHEGFPNLRIVGPGDAWCKLQWGDPPPFDGCDYTDPMCAALLGIYYGYKDEAIAKQFEYYLTHPRQQFDRKRILRLLRSARHPR